MPDYTPVRKMDLVERYFQNPKYTQLMQLIVAFSLGIILSPYSYGFLLFVIYLVLYELVYLYFTRAWYPYWGILFRLAVISAGIYGWIIGRTIVGWRNPFRRDPNQP